MKLSEKLDHLLRQHNYRRKRGSTNKQTSNNIGIEEYLADVSSSIDEMMAQVDKFLPKRKL